MDPLVIGETPLTLQSVQQFLQHNLVVSLSPQVLDHVRASRSVVEQAGQGQVPVYGVNTGFGKLATQKVGPEELGQLQTNLIRSHAIGVGPPLPPPVVRTALLLLINSLAKGRSGVRPALLESLVTFLNSGICPVVPQYGSLGASGDLAPLAHLVLSLLDENPVLTTDGTEHPHLSSLSPELVLNGLAAKEGLALINGTHFTTAVTTVAWLRAVNLVQHSFLCSSLAVDALLGSLVPFREEIHLARPQEGQQWAGKVMRSLLEGSAMARAYADPQTDPRVQDPYSFRCFPQVVGGVTQVLLHTRDILEAEFQCVTDNPVVTAGGDVLSGGNFHAEPVSLVADYMAIAVAKLTAILEKQVEKLLNPAHNFELPAFLTPRPGLNSGFMIAHYTQAALLNRILLLTKPAGVDSIPTSANQEDYVSMGMNAGLKLAEQLDLLEDFMALQFMQVSQALTLRKEAIMLTSSTTNEAVLERIRSVIPRLDQDRPMAPDQRIMKDLLVGGELLSVADCPTLEQWGRWLLGST